MLEPTVYSTLTFWRWRIGRFNVSTVGYHSNFPALVGRGLSQPYKDFSHCSPALLSYIITINVSTLGYHSNFPALMFASRVFLTLQWRWLYSFLYSNLKMTLALFFSANLAVSARLYWSSTLALLYCLLLPCASSGTPTAQGETIAHPAS